MPDPHNLQRFLTAQADIYPGVLAELRQQRKTTHWIWFIFPQIQGLGSSPTVRTYALASLAEATAYLVHSLHELHSDTSSLLIRCQKLRPHPPNKRNRSLCLSNLSLIPA